MNKVHENWRTRLLGRWARWSTDNWGKTLLIALAITIVMGVGISILEMEMTFYSIMPQNSTQVQDFKKIIDNFPFASSVMIVVDGRELPPEVDAPQVVKKAVDAIVEELNKPEYAEYIVVAHGKMNMDFFKDHGLLLSKPEDIKRMRDLYSDLNILPFFTNLNNDFEKEYSGQEENLRDDEDMAISQFQGLENMFTMLLRSFEGDTISENEISRQLDTFLFGETYLMSEKNTMAIAIVQPTFSINDFMTLAPGVGKMEEGAKKVAALYNVSAGLTGLLVVGKDEMVTAEQGIVLSSTIAFFLIIALLIIFFRMFSAPLIGGIPLLLGIVWTIGITGFTINRLTILTAMYMVALLGLGIDFAIHLLATYIQEKDEGKSFSESIINSFKITGPSIITGATTTAGAFFVLAAAQTEMIRELGIVAGIGILSELLAMFILVPALLAWRHSRRVKKGKTESKVFSKIRIKTELTTGLGKVIKKVPLVTALIMLLFGGGFAFFAGSVEIEKNLMNLEAKGLESVILQDVLVEEFGMAPDALYIISEDIEEVKQLEDPLSKLDSVKAVESAAPFILSESEYSRRASLASDYQTYLQGLIADNEINTELLLEEFYRLEANLIEISDMAYIGGMQKIFDLLNKITGLNEDGERVAETALTRIISRLETGEIHEAGFIKYQSEMIPILREKLHRMSSPAPFTISDLPAMITDSFISKDKTLFLVSVLPTQNPWESDFRDIFISQVETVTDKGTGIVLAADELGDMVSVDGLRIALLAVGVVFIILLADFKNLKKTLLTMLPLLFSLATLIGIMGVTEMKLDCFNIISIPLLIGIGIDYSVHVSHRYYLYGSGSMDRVVGKTGTAIFLTTLTTVIGFASFIPSVMRGMSILGIVLSLAMTLAFLFAIIFHPSLLILIEERRKKQ